MNTRLLWLIAGAAFFVAAVALYVAFTMSTKVTPPASTQLVWGAYAGDETDLAQFELTAGHEVNIAATFVGFNEPFPSYLHKSVGQAGKVLLVFWEPTTGFDKILAGDFDEDFAAFAQKAKEYSYPVILVPFNEPNLDEEIWGYGQGANTTDTFIAAWRRIHGFFVGVPNVKFGIAFNNISIPDEPGNAIISLYPGNEYVDYVGLDGFNFDDPWLTAPELFDEYLETIKQYKKPIYIFSTGSAEGERKAAWIDEFYAWMKVHPEIVGFLWFNENKEKDWRINSDPASLAAFKKGLQN
jgi:hypothetical protein